MTTNHLSTTNNKYHEPVWLRGLEDRQGLLTAALESSLVVDNCEWTVTHDFEFVTATESQQEDFILQQVCRLKGLQSLRFLPDRNSQIYLFPVHLLTIVLQEATGLEMLSLGSLELTGSLDDFDHFLYWLRNHQSLQLVRLISCQFLPNDEDHNQQQQDTQQDNNPPPPETNHDRRHHLLWLLDQLATSVSNVPCLKEIELSAAIEDDDDLEEDEASFDWEFSSLAPFQQLYQSEILEKLRLENFGFPEDHLLALFQELEHNNTNLKALFLSSCLFITNEGMYGIAKMLANNQTLTSLSLGLKFVLQDDEEDDECFQAIAQALHQNTTLQNLRLYKTTSLMRPSTRAWRRYKLSPANRRAFLELLQSHNVTLEAMSLFEEEEDHDATTRTDREEHKEKYNFYLALNRMGRKHLVREDATKEQWFHSILQAQVDLSCLFFFLSMKPEMFCGV